jgi:hypothetical protein
MDFATKSGNWDTSWKTLQDGLIGNELEEKDKKQFACDSVPAKLLIRISNHIFCNCRRELPLFLFCTPHGDQRIGWQTPSGHTTEASFRARGRFIRVRLLPTVHSKQYYSLELYISLAVLLTLKSNWNLNKTLNPQNSAKLEVYKKKTTGTKLPLNTTTTHTRIERVPTSPFPALTVECGCRPSATGLVIPRLELG